MNMAALCTLVSNMYQLPIDGYMTIRLEMLVQLVDTFGGIELYVPQEMDYKGSHLDQGYQTLNGDACEFLLRTRHIYNNGDIGRLNMQRQFYAGTVPQAQEHRQHLGRRQADPRRAELYGD